MKLYKIYRDNKIDWDTYDSAIVCAIDEYDARRIHPDKEDVESVDDIEKDGYDNWTTLEHVQVAYIGEAKEGIERGVILASYNAG